jgi:DNA-binding NtrC family response regulator
MNMNQQTLEEAFYILVVDDHDLRRQWTKHALKDAPFRVRITSSAQQGLRCLRQIRFDAVVIGEHLKGMGVKEFVEKVHRAYPDTPLIVSPYTISAERHDMAGSPGAYHCLVLATATQEAALRRMVEDALSKKDAKRRNETELKRKVFPE